MNRIPFTRYLTTLAAAFALCSYTSTLHADDTEIFETQANSNTTSRPKVLVLFDNSGSMATVVEGQRPPYDPSKTDYQGGISGSEIDRIYWVTGDNPEPPAANSNQWFYKSQNRCASSFAGLDNQGFSSTQGARRWVNSGTSESCQNICTATGQPVSGIGVFVCRFFLGGSVVQQCETNEVPGSWNALSTSVHTPPHVECKADVVNGNPGNGSGVADGYPRENVSDTEVFSAATPADSDVNWGNTAYTFYSANYVDYWNDDSLAEDRTRIDIAQQVIGDLVAANTSVDFGLAVFNRNTSSTTNGGRIVRRLIEDMDADTDKNYRSSLVSMIDGVEPLTNTPLCESFYEVYRYFNGSSVLYGKQQAFSDSPDRDLEAESGDNYISPLGNCAFIYVILMTDGEPTQDTAANNAIETLTGETCSNWPDGFGGNQKNCLPNLAGYMSTTDLDGDDTNGQQLALTYTIGFQTDQALLAETAIRGGGQHFTATNADQLASAFQGALLNILTTDSSFTSPAVALDSFTRTESRDDVFFAMFKPDERVDWRGNLKKFKIAEINGQSFTVDRANVPALDPITGEIKATASSFWSNGDGGSVDKGGVGALLANRDPATRTIYTNTGTGGALELFNSTNVTPDAFGFADDETLWAEFGVGSQVEFDNVLAWARGFAIENGAPTQNPRAWIMGDVLHSRPAPVNYGARGGFTVDNPDLRILVGTNSGFVHFFGNDDGQEDWAFFPKELAGVLNKRRVNAVSNENVYGVDLTPVIYRKDVDNDGTIDVSDGDKLWAYFGLRRGGRMVYALDISNPAAPTFLWMRSEFSDGFDELGQTWSLPVLARIPGYLDADGAKPVLIFGAGYDTNKDATGIGTPDSMGRGVFIVDAETGALVRSITPGSASISNVQDTRLQHSVPGEVAVLADTNGFAERLYFGDTGGNVWRVDIGTRLPDDGDSTETWFVTHFADLNEGTVATDRRFFNKPDLVRTTLDGSPTGPPVDAVLMASGDRTNPLATDVENYFYLLRDPKLSRHRTPEPTSLECDANDPDNLPLDLRCFQPIVQNALFDITSNIINNGTDEQQAAAREALATADGWKLRLFRFGEKGLSDSRTLDGQVRFSTFTPATLLNNNPNICEPPAGVSFRFSVDIFTGEQGPQVQLPQGTIDGGITYYFDDEGGISILDPPGTVVSDPNDGDGGSGSTGVSTTGSGQHLPYPIFWYSEDY